MSWKDFYKKELNSEGKKFYRVEKPKGLLPAFQTEPWAMYQEPFRVAPHVYYVSGNIDWACYLIDSGDGLMILDTSMPPVFYLLLDSIYQLGYNVRDIKKILITHGHFDHDGGARVLKELTGAEIYISKEDWEFKKENAIKHPDRVSMPYEADHFYNNDEKIVLGNISISTMLCPGHTPGVTSFFFDDTDPETGKTYHVAMHGGVGMGGVPGDENNELRKRFVNDCEKLKDMDVDIALPSHPNQVNYLAWVPENRNDYSPFVDKQLWHDFMVERAEAARKITDMG